MSNLLNQYETQLGPLLEQAERLQKTGPAWLQEQRKSALRSFQEHGVPTQKNEEWKYTALRGFAETSWKVAQGSGSVDVSHFVEGSIRIVLVNGRLTAEGIQGSDQQVRIGSLSDSVGESVLAKHQGKAVGEPTYPEGRVIQSDVYPFGELNTALFEDAVVIEVIGLCEKVIEIVHVQSGESSDLSFPRVLVTMAPNSGAKIVESYVSSSDNACATIAVTEVFVGEGANLEHIRVQNQSDRSLHIGLWQTKQERDSTYTAYNVCFGSQLARLDQTIWIGGENCTTRLDGVVCANGDQHIDNHTRLDHRVPNCNSFEIYKQVVDDSATVVFNGKIFVHQDAQKTDAKQTNQALLLSPKATIDSKPQLEIFADDVKCTHGATVGQLEDLSMFYMRSRGVPQEQAQAVLVYAFAAEVLELVSIEPVRKGLERRLYEKLGVDLTE